MNLIEACLLKLVQISMAGLQVVLHSIDMSLLSLILGEYTTSSHELSFSTCTQVRLFPAVGHTAQGLEYQVLLILAQIPVVYSGRPALGRDHLLGHFLDMSVNPTIHAWYTYSMSLTTNV